MSLFGFERASVCVRGEGCYSLYVARDDWELAEQVGRDLVQKSVVLHRDEVRMERMAQLIGS